MADPNLPEKTARVEDEPSVSDRRDNNSGDSTTIPPEAEASIKRLMDEGGPRALLSVVGAFSRVGPDPQTAKILAEAEQHAEESRLKGYQATLDQRDKEQVRDHEYRKKVLNHRTGLTLVVMVVAVAGVVTGVILISNKNSAVGGPILVASAMALLQSVGGKPFSTE